jgi:HlyD family secretion protein
VIGTLIGIWRVLTRGQRQRLVLLQILCVVMGFCTIGGLAAVIPFFTVLADPGSIERIGVLHALYQRFDFGNERDFVAALGIGFAAIVLLANAVNLVGTLAMNRFALSVGNEFQVTLFDAYMHRGYHFHAGTSSSKLTSNVIHETGRVTSGLLQSSLTLISSVIAIAFIVGSVIFVNPLAALVSVAGLGASYLLTYALARQRLRTSGRIESSLAAERTRVVHQSFAAIREISAAQRQDYFVAKFARACHGISRRLADTFAIAQSPRYILESLVVGGLVGIALFLSGRGAGVGSMLAQLSFVGFAAYRLIPALQQLFAAVVRIRADRAAFDSIADDLRLARAQPGVAHARAVDPAWRGRPEHELRLHAVAFRYSDDQPPVLHDISLRIRADTTIGLIGANGAGKTTLADVIAGLLVPQSGHIEVDGTRVDAANRLDWQSNVAYVPQDSVLLDASVAQNIALGVPDGEIDRNRLLGAARLARLDECIAGLPRGYDELLGERGTRLSGGQRQRVAIARALYRNASVLIMDEATSALDDATRRDLLATLQGLRGQRTLILITHHPVTLQHCDTVVELRDGTVAAQWSPDERDRSRASVAEPGCL